MRRFGMNQAKAYHTGFDATAAGCVAYTTKYGQGAAALADSGVLGAEVVRQMGQRDLQWGRLAPPITISSAADMLGGQDVPSSTGLASAMAEGIDPDVTGQRRPNEELLGELLAAAGDCGLKVVFTFLTQGNGDEAPPPYDPDLRTCPAVEHTEPGAWLRGNGGLPIGVNWSADDHDGTSTSPTGGYAFPDPATYGDWVMQTLDPSCPYKREYVGFIAEQAADLVLAAAGQAGVDLEDVVEAIEVFNETDCADLWEYSTGSHASYPYWQGDRWGRAWLHAAWAWRQKLGDDSPVRILLPGLTSYHEVAALSGLTWSDKLEYIDGFFHGICEEAVAVDPDVLADLSLLAQGIDLHWYHFEEDDYRHIGYLVLEIAEIKERVRTTIGTLAHTYEDLDPDDPMFQDFPVSVIESGHSVAWRPGPTGRERFQAHEVWRRIIGALAGGANIAGWHAWEANASEMFAGTGLREDSGDEMDPPADSTQREAWYAYQRLTTLLGGKVTGARMLLPALLAGATRADLAALLAASPTWAPWAVVFELDLVYSAFPFAYLVLHDPSGVGSGIRLVTDVIAESVDGTDLQLWYAPTCFLSRSGTVDYPVDLGGLPLEEAIWDGTVPALLASLGVPIQVRNGDDPRLYFAKQQARWRTVVGSGSGLDPGSETSVRGPLDQDLLIALFQRPAWLDDAGVPGPWEQAVRS